MTKEKPLPVPPRETPEAIELVDEVYNMLNLSRWERIFIMSMQVKVHGNTWFKFSEPTALWPKEYHIVVQIWSKRT